MMKCRRMFAVAVGVMLTQTATAQAQSCPAADSLVGPKTNGYLRTKYDDMTDSTVVASRGHYAAPMFGDPFTVELYALYPGRGVTDSATVYLTMETQKVALNALDRSVDKENAEYQDVSTIYVLADDSVRVRLAATEHQTQTGRSVIAGENRKEKVTAVVPMADLIRLANAHTLTFRVGHTTVKGAGQKTTDSAKELVRYLLCHRTTT